MFVLLFVNLTLQLKIIKEAGREAFIHRRVLPHLPSKKYQTSNYLSPSCSIDHRPSSAL
jgi:hypothetical protein